MILQGEGQGVDDGKAWQCRWWSPAPAIFCSVVSGHFSFGAVAVLVAGFAKVHEASPHLLVRSFHDWNAVVSYNSDARVAYSASSEDVMVHVELVDILFSSRLMAMAISVANIVLGGKLHPLSDRAHFEQRREHELARARRPNPTFKA